MWHSGDTYIGSGGGSGSPLRSVIRRVSGGDCVGPISTTGTSGVLSAGGGGGTNTNLSGVGVGNSVGGRQCLRQSSSSSSCECCPSKSPCRNCGYASPPCRNCGYGSVHYSTLPSVAYASSSGGHSDIHSLERRSTPYVGRNEYDSNYRGVGSPSYLANESGNEASFEYDETINLGTVGSSWPYRHHHRGSEHITASVTPPPYQPQQPPECGCCNSVCHHCACHLSTSSSAEKHYCIGPVNCNNVCSTTRRGTPGVAGSNLGACNRYLGSSVGIAGGHRDDSLHHSHHYYLTPTSHSSSSLRGSRRGSTSGEAMTTTLCTSGSGTGMGNDAGNTMADYTMSIYFNPTIHHVQNRLYKVTG